MAEGGKRQREWSIIQMVKAWQQKEFADTSKKKGDKDAWAI